jgi:Flp pilus assembly protein TadD
MQSLGRLIILGGTALALSACGHEPSPGGIANADGWARAAHSEDVSTMVARAEALRARGEEVAALYVLSEAHRRYPHDRAVISAYGRVALLLGHEALAAPLLDQAIAADPGDWRALSAKGVLEARGGRLPDGRRTLAQARMISAGEAIILNNLAVTHLLEGKPAAAASLLRQALAASRLNATHGRRLSRNLALALAMQGRFDEADRLAGERLPRALAEGDMSALRGLLGVSEAQLVGEASNWKPQIAASARLDQALPQ